MDLSLYAAKPDKTIRQHTDELIGALKKLSNLGYIKSERVYMLILSACEYHDYGKANEAFQKRIRKKTKFDESKEIAHNVLSLFFIDMDEFEEKRDYYIVAFAVLNHHHYYDNNIGFLQDENNKELIEKLLTGFKTYKIKRRTLKEINEMLDDKEAVLVKGFIHKCDYSASGGVPIEYENDFLDEGLNSLLMSFRKKKPEAQWNPLQKFCLDNKDENLMITAQTGMGKTEAGLIWIGNNKGFFILPLKTAINAIYDRVRKEIIHNENIAQRVALLHSDSVSYYFEKCKSEMDIMEYQSHSKQLSIPLNISTLDQIFDFVFKYPGYELKIATLSYSKVVIDEIQMYSADLLAYLIRGIQMIYEFGGKIAILTATLPPFVKDLLKSGDNPIPFKEAVFINDLERHNIKTYDKEIDVDFIYSQYIENLACKESNKTLVVCNTVKKAQEVFEKLKLKGVKNIELLHSKFTYEHRKDKEERILKVGETEHKDHCIWVSTQIVEASLDIDFDYLYTELSELSGLFQRLGRCNRKGEKSVEDINCHVFLNVDENLLTHGDKGFIDRTIYHLSKDALNGFEGVLSEKDKVEMIDKYLTTDRVNESDYMIRYRKFKDEIEDIYTYQFDKHDSKLRDIISYNVIPFNIYDENKKEIQGYIDKMTEEKLEMLERVKIRDKIKNYTVPVGQFDVFPNNRNVIFEELKLNKKESIYVVRCNYDEKKGFVRPSKDQQFFDSWM